MVGESSKKTFILDVDDTLMRTQHYYDFARMKFNTLLIRALGEKCPSMDNLNKEYIELYINIVEQNGFSKLEQFPEVMVKYYSLLCERLGARFSQKTANKIYQIGWSAVNPDVYKKTAKLLPGAEETLDFLLAKNDEMFVYTRGNGILQNVKIDTLKLRKWCSRFYIVSTKDEQTFRNMVAGRKKEDCYSVGDSKKATLCRQGEQALKQSGFHMEMAAGLMTRILARKKRKRDFSSSKSFLTSKENMRSFS